jgi:hypothetical protein
MPSLTTLIDGTIPVASDFNNNYTALNQALGTSTTITGYTAGDILYASATNTLSKLPIGSANQILKVSSGLPAWGAGMSVLDRDVVVADVNTTTSETTVYSFTVPGGTLSTNKALRLSLIGDYLNNSGGTSDLTVKVKYGATTVATMDRHTAVAASASRRIATLECMISALAATNAQITMAQFYLSTAAGVAGADAEDDLGLGAIRAVHASVAEDSTADKNLVVTVQHSVSNANTSFRAHVVHLELLS